MRLRGTGHDLAAFFGKVHNDFYDNGLACSRLYCKDARPAGGGGRASLIKPVTDDPEYKPRNSEEGRLEEVWDLKSTVHTFGFHSTTSK